MKRILLAEDDLALGETLAMILTSEGYDVTHAQNGLEAKDLLAKGDFDIVLTDIKMPKMNGLELLKHVKETSSVPVILMTGFAEITEPKEALALGASGFLSKPFTVQSLVETFNSL